MRIHPESKLASCRPGSLGCFVWVRSPIRVIRAEQDAPGEPMVEIGELSPGFTPPVSSLLGTPHPEIKIQNVRLDLIAHAVPGKVRHPEHLQDAAWIALAPLDERM